MTGVAIPQIGMGSEGADGIYLLEKLDGLHKELGFHQYTSGSKFCGLKFKSILNLRETNIQNDLVKAKASTQENEKIKQEIIDHQKDIKLRSQKLINEALSDSKLSIEKTENDITKKLTQKYLRPTKIFKKIYYLILV